MLKKNYEFKQVLTRGNHYSGNIIKAVILKRKFNDNFLGIAVNKKMGKAVNRNRVKRLLRVNYKIIEKNIKSGYAVLFLLRSNIDIKKIDFWSINRDMIKILETAKVLKDIENEKDFNNID